MAATDQLRRTTLQALIDQLPDAHRELQVLQAQAADMNAASLAEILNLGAAALRGDIATYKAAAAQIAVLRAEANELGSRIVELGLAITSAQGTVRDTAEKVVKTTHGVHCGNGASS